MVLKILLRSFNGTIVSTSFVPSLPVFNLNKTLLLILETKQIVSRQLFQAVSSM